jgi:hypothetical protein
VAFKNIARYYRNLYEGGHEYVEDSSMITVTSMEGPLDESKVDEGEILSKVLSEEVFEGVHHHEGVEVTGLERVLLEHHHADLDYIDSHPMERYGFW